MKKLPGSRKPGPVPCIVCLRRYVLGWGANYVSATPGSALENMKILFSMDWFKGKFTGNHDFPIKYGAFL